MMLCLVHHADALSPAVDPQRPLSSRGLARAAALATRIKARGFVPAAIWHSGKLRAKQTAEACLVACHPLAEFKMIRGVREDDPSEMLRQVLLGETRDVLVAGHIPHLSALLDVLVPSRAPFPLHGAVALQSDDDGRSWTEVWREEVDVAG
jgi:phosphohistidine phosphatase